MCIQYACSSSSRISVRFSAFSGERMPSPVVVGICPLLLSGLRSRYPQRHSPNAVCDKSRMSIAETLGQLALFADLTPSQLAAIAHTPEGDDLGPRAPAP